MTTSVTVAEVHCKKRIFVSGNITLPLIFGGILTRGIFITATGTDVGKTYISGLIIKKMRELGYNCGYYKPVLSGTVCTQGTLGDCEHVFKTAGLNFDAKDFVSYWFKPALSPHLAAKMEGEQIKLSKIKSDYEKIKNQFDYLLVEGAGGIICPFGENLLLEDIIKTLNLSVAIIAPSELGAINSAVLTANYAKQANIGIVGIIMNNFDENNFMHTDNKKLIEKLTGEKVIATVKNGAENIIDLSGIFKEI